MSHNVQKAFLSPKIYILIKQSSKNSVNKISRHKSQSLGFYIELETGSLWLAADRHSNYTYTYGGSKYYVIYTQANVYIRIRYVCLYPIDLCEQILQKTRCVCCMPQQPEMLFANSNQAKRKCADVTSIYMHYI